MAQPGGPGLLDSAQVNTALATVYNSNVLGWCGGGSGAVNGWVAGSGVDRSTVQSEECWTGVLCCVLCTVIVILLCR